MKSHPNDHFPDLNSKRVAGLVTVGTGASQARQIANKLDRIPHSVYVEPFLGRGDVFRAKQPAPKEILNDLDCRRVREAKKKACPTTKADNCQRISHEAKISCGHDWKGFLKHDSPETLFFLDPPWAQVNDKKSLSYRRHAPVTAEDVVERTKKLKGAVAIYYKDRPHFRKVLCRKPFRCSLVKGNILGNRYTQILAIKRASGNQRHDALSLISSVKLVIG